LFSGGGSCVRYLFITLHCEVTERCDINSKMVTFLQCDLSDIISISLPFVWTHVCLFVCVFIYVSIHLCMSVCVCVFTYACTFSCMSLYVCMALHTCLYVFTYVCMCVFMYVCACMHVCMYFCTYALKEEWKDETPVVLRSKRWLLNVTEQGAIYKPHVTLQR